MAGAAILTLRLTLDRAAGVISGGGLSVRVDPGGDVLRSWCLKAQDAGIDLAGVRLEMWDRGCQLGDRLRTEPLLCLTALDAEKILRPDPKRKDAA